MVAVAPKEMEPAPVAPEPGRVIIASRRELLGCAEGEEITVRGKIGIATGGIEDFLDLGDKPKSPTTTPLFTVTFADGTVVTCAFTDTPRDAYEKWAAKNRPGAVVTVRGTYYPGKPPIVANGKVLPDGFR